MALSVWRGRVLLGKAAAELIGIKSMMRDMGWDADLKLHVDATVTQVMANRQGIGKIRHLEVRYLWLQEMAKSNGVLNPADVLTKPMSFSEMLGKLGRVHLYSDLGLQSQVEGACRHNVTPVGFCSAFSFACPCHSVHPASR